MLVELRWDRYELIGELLSMIVLVLIIIKSFEFDNASAYDFISIFESIDLIFLISFYIDERDMLIDIDVWQSNILLLEADRDDGWDDLEL